MEPIRYHSIVNKMKEKSGETLVETMVSFVIFLIIMAAITGIVKTATGMNVEARKLSDQIEQAGMQVEADQGTVKGQGEMNFIFNDNTTISQDITVKTADPFTYFKVEQ